MDKDKVVNALNAIQAGQDSAGFHDELEVAIGVLVETGEELIAKVVQDIHDDCESADHQNRIAHIRREPIVFELQKQSAFLRSGDFYIAVFVFGQGG